jgi:hypothetical protein
MDSKSNRRDNGQKRRNLYHHDNGSSCIDSGNTLSNSLLGTLVCLCSSQIAVVSLFCGYLSTLPVLRDFYMNSVLGY